MQVGSIVAVKKFGIAPSMSKCIKWTPIQDEKTPYIIREISMCPITHTQVYIFEEGIIGINPMGLELGIERTYLIELLPPQENMISELMKEVEEKELFIVN